MHYNTKIAFFVFEENKEQPTNKERKLSLLMQDKNYGLENEEKMKLTHLKKACKK